MTTPTAVGTLLQHILTKAETALTDNSRTLPDNRLVSHNAPAWDCCDLLATWCSILKPTTRFPYEETRELRGGARFALDIGVVILRCVPVMSDTSLPTNAEMTTSALDLAADAWSIYHAFICQALDGSLIADCECDNAAVSNIQPLGPQGGCGGYRFTVTVEMSGIT